MRNINLSDRFAGLASTLQKIKIPSKIIFFIVGIASTVWFLIRVIPKPSRATYPCMRAAAPFASSFVIYLLGITSFTFFFKKARQRLSQSRYMLASAFAVIGLIAGAWTVYNTNTTASAAEDNTPQAPQTANEPVGIGKGIFPGRVVWAHNPAATNENCDNLANSNDYWYMDSNTDQNEVNKMLSASIQKLTGTTSDAAAWDSIFTYYNRTHGRGNVGYTAGEKIAIKINLNGINNGNRGENINTSPHLCNAVLDDLVNIVGVAQADIGIGDPNCSMNSVTYNKIHGSFPSVKCWGSTAGLTPATATASAVLFASDGSYEDVIPQAYADAAYLINLAVFKKHHRAGISLGSKNHFGSLGAYTGGAWHLHPSLPCSVTDGHVDNYEYGVYRCFVDIMGHKDLGGKTVLYINDGLWASTNWGHHAVRWHMAPFNDDWPSSLFVSFDPVAIESVGYDFLYEEFDVDQSETLHPEEGGAWDGTYGPYPHFKGTDDFLHQAASSDNWPAGLEYDPENDGSILGSLGVHEHWNNPIDKQYTRNLGTGNGIELCKINMSNTYTPDNSNLLSEHVNTIFVDSFDVKWFGTDQGISRFDNTDWTDITTGNHLVSNNVRKFAYEKFSSEDQLWVATAGGLTVLSYDTDGVTDANTYTTGNSDIISNNVVAIGIDSWHNKWACTSAGLSVFTGTDWADTTEYMDEDHHWESFVGTNLYAAAGNDTMLIASDSGVIRFTYDEIDGFTGASAYGEKWSRFESYTVNFVGLFDYVQYYGTPEGAFIHHGNDPKTGFEEPYTMESGLVSNNVRAIEIDDDGNIWFGTDKGISVKTNAGWFKYPAGMQAYNLNFKTAGTEATVHWISGTGMPEGYGLIDPVVNDIKKDFSGKVWVATNGGIEFFESVPGVPAEDLIAKRVVFMKTGNTGTVTPVNGVTYTANNTYGAGTALNGWYCVYNGPGDSVVVYGLTLDTEYRVMVCEYTGDAGSEVYVTTTATENPANFIAGYSAIETETNEPISVYPVPFDNYITINGSQLQPGSIVSVYALNGQLLYQAPITGNTNRINTSSLGKGIYIIRITDGDRNYSVKIVK